MSFKANPYANPSVGAPTPTGYNTSGAERLAAGALTTGTNPIHSAADATLAAAQFTDKGIEVADGSVVRVVLGDLGGGSYGLKLYQSDGSTAIIDGTSDMFKILTSGSTSVTAGGGATVTQTITLSSLGTFTATPAFVAYISPLNTNSSSQSLGSRIQQGDLWGAPSSGGSPTQKFKAIDYLTYWYTALNGSSQATINLIMANASASSQTNYGKYYLLQESAI